MLTKILDGKLEFNATQVLLKASEILNTRHLSYHSVTTWIRCHRFAVTQWCSLLRVDTPEDHVAPKTKQKTLMYHGPSSLAPAVWKCEYDWGSTLVTTEFISTRRPLHYIFSPDSGRAVLFPHCLLLSLNATAVNQPPHLPPSYLRDSSNEVCVGIMAQKAACETVSYKGIHYPIHVCAKRKQRPVETLFKQFTSYKQCFSAAAAKQQEKALLCTSSEPFCHL